MELAEAQAAYRAVKLAQEMSFFGLQVEGDCLVVIQALKAQARCNTLYGHVIEDTRRLGAALQFCQFRHVPREGNKLVHVFVKRVVLSTNINVWIEDLFNDLLKKKKVLNNKMLLILFFRHFR